MTDDDEKKTQESMENLGHLLMLLGSVCARTLPPTETVEWLFQRNYADLAKATNKGDAPDAACVTTPDGDCVASKCMHTQPAPREQDNDDSDPTAT